MTEVIYIVEDDNNIRELIEVALVAHSYEVVSFISAEELFKVIHKTQPDLFILDIMLPGTDGLTLLNYIRQNKETKNIPVLMLTAKSSELDKVKGLEQGADDYMVKPFGVMELAARVKALLRRANISQKILDILIIDDIALNTSLREVKKDGKVLDLTLKEYELLKLLMEHTEKVLLRDEILDEIWGEDYLGETRTLDMHIRALRLKLGDDADNPRYIKTVRGVGYRFSSNSGF